MGDYQNDVWDAEWDETGLAGEPGDDFDMHDPLEDLPKRDQDIFFRVLDLIPDEKRETAIEYFMDHPNKVKAVVDNVKKKKELIVNKDQEGLKKLFAQEQIVLEKIDQIAAPQ